MKGCDEDRHRGSDQTTHCHCPSAKKSKSHKEGIDRLRAAHAGLGATCCGDDSETAQLQDKKGAKDINPTSATAENTATLCDTGRKVWRYVF